MTLFIISIPFMIVAVGIAVIPLIKLSRSEMRHITAEVERHREEHRLAHEAHLGHRHAAHDAHRRGVAVPPTPAIAATRTEWHQPVLIRHDALLTPGV